MWFSKPALFFSLVAVATASDLEARATCNADNCLRAVFGTIRGQQASHTADCRKFGACTVTPLTSTVIVTTTVAPAVSSSPTTFVEPITLPLDTSDPGINTGIGPIGPFGPVGPVSVLLLPLTLPIAAEEDNKAERRAVSAVTLTPVTSCASAVPGYASACSGAKRYSSACSCGGVTAATTTTLGAKTVTSTSTVTAGATQSVNPVCFLSILQTNGQSLCRCPYEVECGHVTCANPVFAGSNFNFQQCVDACDGVIGCTGATLQTQGGNCFFCTGPTDTIIDGNYQAIFRDGTCVNPLCH